VNETHARDLLAAERERLDTIRTDIARDGLVEYGDAQEIQEEAGGQHPADAGSVSEGRSRDIGLLEQIEGELRDVEDALRRLDEGTYGQCVVCGRPIPDDRLEANPTARFDVEHEPRSGPSPLHDPGRDSSG
jgi:RNA polymerase-binding transcription factor DksA